MRPTEAQIHLGAVRANTDTLRKLAPDATLCAVVKADGYGHGADAIAAAALSAGASWLAVATLEEAIGLRDGGIGPDVPILLLSELDPDELGPFIVDAGPGLRPTIGSASGADSLSAALRIHPPRVSIPVHLKIDTGMHRIGVDPTAAIVVADRLTSTDGVHLEGIWTHLAVADDPDDQFTQVQLDRFDRALAALAAHGHRPTLVHAANSAGVIGHPRSHRDLTRVGIALYGVKPDPDRPCSAALEPALSLVSRVRAVRTVQAGEGVSYGRYWRAEIPTPVATVPIGYADGIRRDSPEAGVQVLVRGRRRPILGVVTMDQLMIAVDPDVDIGDEVVLIGSQGSDHISADEIAGRLGTIGYEVLTSLGPRIPRRFVG
jgi:alanine racemase